MTNSLHPSKVLMGMIINSRDINVKFSAYPEEKSSHLKIMLPEVQIMLIVAVNISSFFQNKLFQNMLLMEKKKRCECRASWRAVATKLIQINLRQSVS